MIAYKLVRELLGVHLLLFHQRSQRLGVLYPNVVPSQRLDGLECFVVLSRPRLSGCSRERPGLSQRSLGSLAFIELGEKRHVLVGRLLQLEIGSLAPIVAPGADSRYLVLGDALLLLCVV